MAGPRCSIDRGASTMVPEIAERYRADGQDFTPIEVPIWTLAEVVADYVPGSVDFLKVDVEGFEREVLAGADWFSFRPRVVVIEATVPKSDEPAHEAWEPMLFEAGYRLALFDGLNRFYAHADEAALLQTLAIPANVFEDFVPYVWRRQVDQAQQWAHSLQEALTHLRQERDQLYESEARACATASDAEAQAAMADESTARALAEAHSVRAELSAQGRPAPSGRPRRQEVSTSPYAVVPPDRGVHNSISPMTRDHVLPSVSSTTTGTTGCARSCRGWDPIGLLMHRPWLEDRVTFWHPQAQNKDLCILGRSIRPVDAKRPSSTRRNER